MDTAKPTLSNLPSSIYYVYVCVSQIYSLVLMYGEIICIWDRKQDSKGVVGKQHSKLSSWITPPPSLESQNM